MTLTEGSDTRSRVPNGTLLAGIHVDLPDWDRADWADVVIRARADSESSVTGVGLRFNLRDGRPTASDFQSPYQFAGQNSPDRAGWQHPEVLFEEVHADPEE